MDLMFLWSRLIVAVVGIAKSCKSAIQALKLIQIAVPVCIHNAKPNDSVRFMITYILQVNIILEPQIEPQKNSKLVSTTKIKSKRCPSKYTY